MRQLNLTQNQPYLSPKLPQLGVLTHIEELSKHDLIYCYYLLKEGEELILTRDYARFWDDQAVVLHYKQFKLGYLNVKTAALIVRHLNKGNTVRALIKQDIINKNTPFQTLDIQITIYNGFGTFH